MELVTAEAGTDGGSHGRTVTAVMVRQSWSATWFRLGVAAESRQRSWRATKKLTDIPGPVPRDSESDDRDYGGLRQPEWSLTQSATRRSCDHRVPPPPIPMTAAAPLRIAGPDRRGGGSGAAAARFGRPCEKAA